MKHIQFVIERPVPGSTEIYPSDPVLVWVETARQSKEEFPCSICTEVYVVDMTSPGISELSGEQFKLSALTKGGIGCVCDCMGHLL